MAKFGHSADFTCQWVEFLSAKIDCEKFENLKIFFFDLFAWTFFKPLLFVNFELTSIVCFGVSIIDLKQVNADYEVA